MANEMVVTITGDASKAMDVMSNFSRSVKSGAGEIEGHFNGLAKAVDNFAAPLTKALALLGGGAMFKSAIDKTVEFGVEVGKIRRVMGGSSEDASALAVAIKKVYGDTDTYLGGVAKLTRTVNSNSEGMKAMGIATHDAHGNLLPMAEIVQNTNTALMQYKEGADRDAASTTVLGRSWVEWQKYLKITPGLLEECAAEADALHKTLGPDAVKKISDYRAGMERVDQTLDAVKINVGLQVMPTLSRLAQWFAASGPGLVDGTVHGIEALGTVFGSTSVQIGIGLMVLRGPLTSTLGFVQNFGVGVGQIFQRLVLGVQGPMGAMGQSIMSFLNPWTLATVAIVAGGFALERWISSASRAASEYTDLVTAASAHDSVYERLTGRMLELDKIQKDSKLSIDQKKKAEEEEKTIIAQLCSIYPDFMKFLYDEHGKRREIAEAIKLENQKRLEDAQNTLAEAQAHQANALALVAERKARMASMEKMGQGASSITGGSGYVIAAGIEAKRIEDAEAAAKEYSTAIQVATTNLQKLQQQQTESVGGKNFHTPETATKSNFYQTEMNRLLADDLKTAQAITLEAKALNETKLAGNKLEGEQQAIAAALKAKHITPEGAAKLRAKAEQAYTDKVIAIYRDSDTERVKLEADLQEKIEGLEEGGLAKRESAIAKTFAAIREENKKLSQDGKPCLSDDQIFSAENAARARARIDQVNTDLEKLKKELSELSQVKGGLSEFDRTEVLDRWKKKGGTSSTAAGKYEQENHIGQGALKGAQDGLQTFLAKSENTWTTWKNFTVAMLGGVQNSFSGFFGSILSHGQTAAQKWDALWKGISGSAIKALSDMGAQELVHWGVQKAIAIWDAARGVKKKADTAVEVAGEGAKATAAVADQAATATAWTAANAVIIPMAIARTAVVAASIAAALTAGAAEAWVAYGAIPYVGAGLAMAQIVEMEASVATAGLAVVGAADGGWFDRPTMAVIGEGKRPELVIPDTSFKDFATNLSHNILAQERQTQSYNAQAASYTLQAQQQGQRNRSNGQPLSGSHGSGMVHNYAGATIIATNSRQWEDMVAKGQRDYDMRKS